MTWPQGIRERRRRAVRGSLRRHEDADDGVLPLPCPGDDLLAAERRALLAAALGRLTAQCRQVLELHYPDATTGGCSLPVLLAAAVGLHGWPSLRADA